MDLLIYGAGGFGREVAWLASEADTTAGYRVAAFIDDDPDRQHTTIAGLDVLSPTRAAEMHRDAKFVVAVGSPGGRRRLVATLIAYGLQPATLIHRGNRIGPRVSVAAGSVICAGTTITTDASIGEYAQVNLHCTIGHDAILGDYATLAPGVHVSGRVHIESDVYVGTGAVIINGSEERALRVGAGAVIGAGAVVTRSVPAGETWVGVPAKPKTVKA